MKLFRKIMSGAVACTLILTAAEGSGTFRTSAGEKHVPGVTLGFLYEWCWDTVREGDFVFGVRRDRFTDSFNNAELNVAYSYDLDMDRRYKEEYEDSYDGGIPYNRYDVYSECEKLVDELVLLEYDGTDREVTVPAEVDGRPVTAIGANAFSGLRFIDKVTLPDSIDYAPASAFRMSGIDEINIPRRLDVIPSGMFYGCSDLKKVTGLDHVILCAPDAFEGTDITIPENITQAYTDSSLDDLNWASYDGWLYSLWWDGNKHVACICGLEEEKYADVGEDVDLCPPAKLGSVPVSIFDLNVTTIPGQLHIVFPESYEHIFSDFSSRAVKSVEFLNKDCHVVASFTGSDITEIEMPSRAEYLPSMFQGCRNLKKFTAAEGAEEVYFSTKTFAHCEALESVIVPESCTRFNIGDEAFMYDKSLKEVVLPGSATFSTIRQSAFYRCKSLEKLTIPSDRDAAVNIENNAFTECSNLKEIKFSQPFSGLYVGREAFKDCESLETFDIPGGTGKVTIEQYAFTGTAIPSLDAGEGWSIGPYSFLDCNKLETVTLDGAKVDQNAFQDCSSLSEVSISGAAKLSKGAFSRCGSLKNIVISGRDYTMNDSFYDCPELRTINGRKVFEKSSGDFAAVMKDIVLEHFAGADNVGFINDYVNYQVKKVISEIITPEMSEMEKARAVHDWICQKTRYSSADEQSYTDHNDASVFLMRSTVCDGYTRAFNLLAHEAGLETCAVASSDHAWNIVKIGGLYFHVDTTWDDQHGDRRWFLKTDDEMYQSGGSHKNWHLNKPSDLHSFQKEELPKSVRSMGDANADGSINTADLVCLSRYLLGSGKLSMDDATVCDLNFDGRADTFDMVKLRTKVIG